MKLGKNVVDNANITQNIKLVEAPCPSGHVLSRQRFCVTYLR